MSINLQPIKGASTSNCFFFTLSTLLRYYGNETYLHNACLWDFNFSYNPNLRLEDCLFEDELYTQCYDYIRQTTGLTLAVMKTDSYKETVNKLLEMQKLVLVHFDSYFCQWNYNYLKYHYDHFFIITDYKDGIYTCVDSFYLDETAELSDDLFNKGIMHIIENHYQDLNTDRIKIAELVIDSMQVNTKVPNESKMFKDMNLMADSILNIDKDKEFVGHDDVKTVPLFSKIQNIVLNRNALGDVCKQLSQETGLQGYIELSEMFATASQEWNMLLVLLMKFFVTGMQRPLMNASQQLKSIADFEVLIAKKFNDVCLGR
jgi:hypothetical protein